MAIHRSKLFGDPSKRLTAHKAGMIAGFVAAEFGSVIDPNNTDSVDEWIRGYNEGLQRHRAGRSIYDNEETHD